jgi:hypothetical protein
MNLMAGNISTSEQQVTCVYCGQGLPRDEELLREHIRECPFRPEVALSAKIQALMNTGDAMLEILHSMTKAVTVVEGMRTKAWEIYHDCEEAWRSAKSL